MSQQQQPLAQKLVFVRLHLGRPTHPLEIPKEQLEIAGQEGEGEYGRLFRAFYMHKSRHGATKHPVALKIIRVPPERGSECYKELIKDVEKLREMEHCPRLLRPIGVCPLRKLNRCAAVIPFVFPGSLESVLDTMGSQVDWDVKVQILEHVVEGLSFLHSHGVYHLHLKTSNVLVDDNYDALLSDYGMENWRKWDKETRKEKPKDGLYMFFAPPEHLSLTTPPPPPCDRYDVYGFGVIMWQMASQAKPRSGFEWQDLQTLDHTRKAIIGGTRPQMDMVVSNVPSAHRRTYTDTIEACWKTDPTQRLHLPGVKARIKKLKETPLTDIRLASLSTALQGSMKLPIFDEQRTHAVDSLREVEAAVQDSRRIGISDSPTTTSSDQQVTSSPTGKTTTVAAAVAAASGPTPARQTARICIVCCDRVVDTALRECGHARYCMECALQLYHDNSKCPECRQDITGILKLFF